MRALALTVGLTLALPLGAQAQSTPLALEVVGETGGVRAQFGDFLEGPGMESSLASGLPVRLRLITELWRDRFVDALEGTDEWRATVVLDPLSDRFRLETPGQSAQEVATLEEARAVLQGWAQPSRAPSRPGTFYYLARLEVETLSLSDLDELRRWLRGDLAPAVGGDQEVGGALGRGFRRVLVRVFGLPVQRFEARTARFDWG